MLLILAGVAIALGVGNNGILKQSQNAKVETDKASLKEKLEMESVFLNQGITLGELQEKITQEGITCQATTKSLFVEKDGNEYTLLEDGTIIEGKIAYLDIADGSIQLKNNGYIQGTEALVEFNGKYIITGKTTENTVSVIEKGTYNITLKDLDIEVTSGNVSAFDANKNMATSTRGPGILCDEGGIIKIDGGNILAKGNTSAISYTPTDGTNNIYLTPIKLKDVAGNQKIESLTTSDNIEYGIKDMYTFEDNTSTTSVDETGMIYLYLPVGSRTITITAGGKTYSGTIETKAEENEIVILNEV